MSSEVTLGRAAAGAGRGALPADQARCPLPGLPGGPPPSPCQGRVGLKRQQDQTLPSPLVNRRLEPRSLCLLFQVKELISGRPVGGGACSLTRVEPCGFAGQAGPERRARSHVDGPGAPRTQPRRCLRKGDTCGLSVRHTPNKDQCLFKCLQTRGSEALSGRRGKARSPSSHEIA